MLDPMQFLGVKQQELGHQRQLMEVMQHMQQQMLQMAIFRCLAMQNFAGRNSTKKSTVGGVAMWSGQFAKAWLKTMGVLSLSSGESELAAVVRAAIEGMGLKSILNDFCLCDHVAIKSLTQLQQLGWSTGSD